jgi:arylsulfatase A-like enzyme
MVLGACSEARPKPNVLLITVDTLRADFGGAAAPALAAWSERAVVFEQGRAPTSWTLPSLASVMTGDYPSTTGCFDMRSKLDDSFSTLAERLAAAGYATSAVASHLFLRPDYGLAQGFDTYNTDLVKNLMKSHEAISSPGVTQRALEWLDEHQTTDAGAPFFLWAHYFDPHEVYHEHKGFVERYGATSELDRYRNEVGFTDQWIGRLLGGLKARGLDDNTIIVLIADHGEEFEDHGGLRHGHTLFDELVRVPFVISVPGQAGLYGGRVAPKRLATAASSVDVLPTLLELCDVNLGGDDLAGQSLVPALLGDPEAIEAPRPLLAELRLREGRAADAVLFDGWKLIVHRDGERQGQAELYNLVADPAELNDLALVELDRVAQYRELLTALLTQAETRAARFQRGQNEDLDAADVESLGDLGYVDKAGQ